MQGSFQSLGARTADAVVSAVSADQRIARGTRIRRTEDSACHIRWAFVDQAGYEL
jgi:hypothetical protein